jgi:hypothetical protein
MVRSEVDGFVELDSFVDGVEEYQDGESVISDQYAYNFEEILIDLEVVDSFDKLADFIFVAAELVFSVNFVRHYSFHLVAHIENSK